MIRKHTVLGLALLTLVAFGAHAQSAPASPLTLATGEVHITTYQEGTGHIFEFGESGTLTCTMSTSDATATSVSGQINEISVAPTYTGGTAFGSGEEWKVNRCTYIYTKPTSLGAGVVPWSGSTQLHLVCPVGKSFAITPTFLGASGCTLFIGAQTPTGGRWWVGMWFPRSRWTPHPKVQ